MGKNFARAADAINGFQPGDFLPNMIFLLFFLRRCDINSLKDGLPLMGKTRRKHAISPLSPTQIRDKNLEINQIYRFTTFAEEGSNGKQE